MEKISVKAARQPAAIGHNVLVQGWIRTRRDCKGGFSFLEAQRRLLPGQPAGRRRRRAAELRERGQAPHRRLQRRRSKAR